MDTNKTLTHYGIKGMRWGIRRTPEELGHKNIKKATKLRYNQWGADKYHNVLYVTGASGSGKSTIGKMLSKDASLISLDYYLENVPKEDFEWGSNKDFNSFLKSKGVDVAKVKSANASSDKAVIDFQKAIASYGQELHPSKKVVVEGAQIGSMYIKIPSGSPVMIANQNIFSATYRRMKRDNEKLQKGKAFVKDYIEYHKKLKVFKSNS